MKRQMVHCHKCNKVISSTDDLNVIPASNPLKTESYCNDCSAELSKKWGGAFFRRPMNNKHTLSRRNLPLLFFIPVFILLGIVLVNDPLNLKTWFGLAVLVFLALVWKKRNASVKRTIEEVRNTPEVKAPKKEVAITSSSLKCDECGSFIASRKKANFVRIGFSMKNLCNNCYFRKVKNKSPFGFSSFSFPVLVNTPSYKLILAISTFAFFVLVGFLVFDRDRPDRFQMTFAAASLFVMSVIGWVSILKAKSRV